MNHHFNTSRSAGPTFIGPGVESGSIPPLPVKATADEVTARLHRLEIMVDALIRRFDRLDAKPKRVQAARGAPPDSLTSTEQAAWTAYCWGIEQHPALATATVAAVYRWLYSRPEITGRLPPRIKTFERYICAAKRFHGIATHAAQRGHDGRFQDKRPESLNGRSTALPDPSPKEAS